jgi:hypothetical protein
LKNCSGMRIFQIIDAPGKRNGVTCFCLSGAKWKGWLSHVFFL